MKKRQNPGTCVLAIHIIHIFDQLIILFLAGGLDHADQLGLQLAAFRGSGTVAIIAGITVSVVTAVSAAASGSGLAAGVPAVAVAIAGIALPVIIRMQVIVQLEDPVPVAVIGHGD